MPGLVTIACARSVRDTADRLVKLIEANGLTVFLRLDHAANAAGVGMALRPTELLVFGNPKGGTPLMRDRQTVGLDLPFKVLVWEDEQSKTWLTYHDPDDLMKDHGLGPASAHIIETIKAGVGRMAQAVATPKA